MRELSLHLLDLIENATRAGCRTIEVTVAEDRQRDELVMEVVDDGRGIGDADAASLLHPFYTTKQGKRTGLGLSLFHAAAQRAGGELVLGAREGGGTVVRATMGLGNIDRAPLGDLAGTLAVVVCTHPEVQLRCRLRVDGQERVVVLSELSGDLGNGEQVEKAYRYTQEIQAVVKALGMKA